MNSVPTTKRDWALWAAERGFWVFPVRPDTKRPAIRNWQALATRSKTLIELWWSKDADYNIGYFTGKFGSGTEALVVLDVDVKFDSKGQNGLHTLFQLQLDNDDLPDTFYQDTPSGGAHFCFRFDTALRSSVRKLGPGFDVKSSGGYILGAGSTLQGEAYTPRDRSVLQLPAWIASKCARKRDAKKQVEARPHIDDNRAEKRAIHYLIKDAPLAIEGEGGDHTTFVVAATLKDLGIKHIDAALYLLLSHWNDRCSPPWEVADLQLKVMNAYSYGEEPLGVSAPETQFEKLIEEPAEPEHNERVVSSPTNQVPTGKVDTKTVHPFEELNKEFSFVIAGGGHHILWETTDAEGKYSLQHLQESTFHAKFASKKMTDARGKTYPISKLWMEAAERKSYDGLVFAPGQKCDPRFFNLWKRFAVEPSERKENNCDAVKAFLSHITENICANDPTISRWLIGYFAHLVQKPQEKPLVALVFKGKKGVGKSAVTDIVGHLLGNSYLSVANKRFIVGNFNSHLENCLMATFEEAFWSGDRQTDGILKDLITGKHHFIERKNQEPYKMKNITRVCIIGNEEWIVPASQDERRYAVFNVGEARKQDIRFFEDMRLGMEAGGYEELLRYLLDFDLTGLSFNLAPQTEGLHEQKLQSLDLFHQWWRDSLNDGELINVSEDGSWPTEVRKDQLRDGFFVYLKNRQIRSRFPNEKMIGKQFKECALIESRRIKIADKKTWIYCLPSLHEAREKWDRFIGHKTEWNTE